MNSNWKLSISIGDVMFTYSSLNKLYLIANKLSLILTKATLQYYVVSQTVVQHNIKAVEGDVMLPPTRQDSIPIAEHWTEKKYIHIVIYWSGLG